MMTRIMIATALLAAWAPAYSVAESRSDITVAPGDRIIVELFADASKKVLAQWRPSVDLDRGGAHWYLPIVCTVESIEKNGTLRLFGFKTTESILRGEHPPSSSPLLVTIRLTVSQDKLKSKLCVKEFPESLNLPSVPRDVPSAFVADATVLETRVWAETKAEANAANKDPKTRVRTTE